jgi:hypothetical protein
MLESIKLNKEKSTMNGLEKLITEQNNLNTWIEEKVKKLRDHQEFLDKVLIEKFTSLKLDHVRKTSDRKSHLFTYNELSIEIEIKNPVDNKKLTLSEAVTKRLLINIWIKRKIEAIPNLYVINDITQYKQGEDYKYVWSNDKEYSDILEIMDTMFNQEVEERIKLKDKEDKYPF